MNISVPLCGAKDGSRHVDHLVPGRVNDVCCDSWPRDGWKRWMWSSWKILGSRTECLWTSLVLAATR